MMLAAVPPILVVATGEILAFESLEEASRYMEPIDVKNGEYRAVYDRNGRKFRPVVTRKPRRGLQLFPVEVSSLVADDGDPKPLELGDALREFLGRVGQDATVLRAAQLDELLARTVEATGYEPSARR